MRPLHNRLHPLRIREISNTNILISPLKNVRHPTASTYCHCWTAVVGNNSLSKMYIYARCFVQCYKAHCGAKVLILWSWQRRFLRLCIHNIHTRTIEHYIRMYVYAPVLEAAATTMLMVWLLPCFQRCGICASQKQEKMQISTYMKTASVSDQNSSFRDITWDRAMRCHWGSH
jgi:hypothetical protein